MTSSHAPRHALTRRLRPLALAVAVIALVWAAPAAPPAQAQAPGPTTFGPELSPGCKTPVYTVPAGIRYIQVVAIGGAGAGGSSYNSNNTGGAGGSGAQVTAIVPVTPGQSLIVGVAHNGDAPTDAGFPSGGDGMNDAGNNGNGGGASVVETAAGNVCLTSMPPRGEVLVLAGGGGGGGGATSLGSGGNGGNAGANADFSGQAGSAAYHLDSDTGHGKGGGGGSATAAGNGGAGGCGLIFCSRSGLAGSGFQGGDGITTEAGSTDSLYAGGAGGGGWWGGGGGGSGRFLGGGGGGAGSSYVTPAAHPIRLISTDTSRKPSITITPYPTPTTTATLSGTTSGNDWYTSAVTVTLTASSGHPLRAPTYYALDNPACNAKNLAACQTYLGPFTVSSNGFHTLTSFTVDTLGLDGEMLTRSFVLTTTSAGVSAASITSGTDPTATANGGGGTITVSGAGSGVVGAAVYDANPAGAPAFNSNGAYVDVIVSGSGLTSLTIKDCHLNGGTQVYWWTGTAWALVSNQTYDAATGCVTITVNSTTVPTLSQLTGTVFAAGRPPSITAVAKTVDGKTYTAGAWTNQSVTVTFTCSANATPTAPVTRASDGQNQAASGTCTDGLRQTATTTFTSINVDKTPPTCSIRVSPTVLWAPDSKLVAITGTARAGDNLSGVASVVGGSVTGNEALAPGDVQGFAINTAFGAPLNLSAVVNITGQLRATRNPSGSGRTYSQTVTVRDQAGNTNTTPCTWTVTVPHDQATGQ